MYESSAERDIHFGRPVVLTGWLLFLMELWKQLTLWLLVEQGHYNVWYFPFQLCSMPMYLSIFYGLLRKRNDRRAAIWKHTILTFLQDYGFLGGTLTLVVHDGLLHPGHPFLTAHGFLWHILMVLCALYIRHFGLAGRTVRDFGRTIPLFAFLATIAECINVILHSYGDCDMFYISPYHRSSQIIFCDIDRALGRPAGIFIYLASIVCGAFLVHVLFSIHHKNPIASISKLC